MRNKVAEIKRGDEWLDLYDDGCIGHPEKGVAPSGSWLVIGAVTRNNFGTVTRRYSLADILRDPGSIPWHHANGRQKTFIQDYDHGFGREWCSPGHRVVLC